MQTLNESGAGVKNACFLQNILSPKNFHVTPIDSILADIKNERHKAAIAALPDSVANEKAYKAAKEKLPAWAFNGTFSGKVDNASFVESNGFFHIDVDGLTIEQVETVKQKLIVDCPHLYAIWVSPSGRGLKILLRIPDDSIHNDSDFKKAYAQIEPYFLGLGVTIDKSCKDVRRLCFVCSDADIYINVDAPAYLFDMAIWEQINKTKNTALPATAHPIATPAPTNSKDFALNNVRNILLRASKGNYHESRLKAGRLAGGYVVGGVLDQTVLNELDAINRSIHAQYGDSEEVQKTEAMAILDGFSYGMRDPITSSSTKTIETYLAKPFLDNLYKIVGCDSQGHTDNENVISSQSAPVLTTPTFKTLSLRELLNRKYVTNWLVKGVIERGNLALFFGDSASGKTFYIMDMCFCIAAGIYFKGKATKQGNVLYICGEGFSGLQKRFMALYQHYGVMPENLHLSERPAALMDIASALAVMRKIEEIGNVSLIVIDTFHRNMGGGSEDSAEDIGEFLKNVDGFLKPTGAAVAIIHHSGHGEKGRSRGSSSIRAAMDVEYQVTKDQLTNRVTVTNTKMKDWQAPPPACFSMNVVNLLDDDNQPISDEDGELLTSVILEAAEPTTSKSKALDGRQQDVLAELHKAIEKHGIPPTDDIKNLFPDSPQNIPDKVVHSDKWRELAYKVIDVNTQDAKKKAFQRCTSALKTVYKIGFHDDYYWII
ncbi:hypothetical protein BCS42_03870 [Crenothrix sp. D3]|nr:hypothetical protein BCS42_03870 [Crenothrix sp. D3]